jgi:hypothetical protein
MLNVSKRTDAESILSAKAILACPSISGWTARKYDRKITHEFHQEKNMRDDAGRYNKRLLAEKDLEEIVEIDNRARRYHLVNTLAWANVDGQRLLPTVKYIAYCEAMNEFKQQHDAAVDRFVPRYPDMIREAETRLNGAFDPADYPHPNRIRAKFNFVLDFMPVPVADFRCQLKADDVAALEQQMQDRMRTALEQTQREAMARAVEVLSKMIERLRAYKPAPTDKKGRRKKGERGEGAFRDSLVENVRDLIPVLRSFNFADDREFDRLCDRMARQLCDHDAEQLRDSEAVRVSVADAAEKILADVEQFMA